jgi:phospholipase D1/2
MSQGRILKPGSNCWQIGEVVKTGLLVDGRDYYRAFYQAAKDAERYILLSGWQFDSNVVLLRGKDAEAAGVDVPLLSFLNDLCEQKPGLHIYILAWDFSMLYSIDREWFQEWYFNWTTNERLKFCFDCCDSFDASHHQKFVVIDGIIAFVGGLDLCSGRWDERDHRVDNPHRVNADQTSYQPFHDVQSYHVGPVAQKLAELFETRWKCVGGEELDLPSPPAASRVEFERAVPIAATRVAISRTHGCHTGDSQGCVQEIRRLFLDAIHAAEDLIYIENQYFSSKALYNALLERMKDTSRSRLEIVLIIAKDAEAALEQLSIGFVQTKLVRHLQQVAAEAGHSLGIYHPASVGPDGNDLATYIHSKLFLVDDRFLSVGSANMNNRSLGYDTELNVAWEIFSDDPSIRDVRVNLLAEHTGLELAACGELRRIKGLVKYLDHLADDGSSRLRHHPVESISDQYQWVASFFPDGLPFDPEGPEYTEETYERMSAKEDSFFTKGLTSLKDWFLSIGQTSTPR